MLRSIPLIAAAAATALSVPPAQAASSASAEVEQLLKLDLQRLLDVDITLSSRVTESAFDAAAAVYVLTQEDIRRSGHRRLAEILRMVPGLHVGKWDSNKWAVSSRNALSRFSSTMLVMIDGRHVYTPLYGGVRWEIQDVMLEDIERIEVIRGPGGPLWGANAVDGIINIVTRPAADTVGTLAYAGMGDGEMRQEAGLRHGARTSDNAAYRIYAKTWHTGVGEYLPREQSTHGGRRNAGDNANDSGLSWSTGTRFDWSAGPRDALSLQANAFHSVFDEERASTTQVVPNVVHYHGANALLHWRRQLGDRESIELRTTLDRVDIDDDVLPEKQTLLDIDFQHSIGIRSHQITWGLGYRYYRSETSLPRRTTCSTCFGLSPMSGTNQVTSAFVQDQIALTPSWTVTLGSKFESSHYTNFNYQPTLRSSWKLGDNQTLWAAATRSVRVPTRLDRERAFYNVPPALSAGLNCASFSNGVCILAADNRAWVIRSYEAGYRSRPTTNLGFDLALFRSDYRNNAAPGSSGRYDVKGFESVVRFQPSPRWQLEANFTWAAAQDRTGTGSLVDTPLLPTRSAHLRSLFNWSDTTQIDALLYRVGEMRRNANATFPAYTRLDLRLGWRPNKTTDISLWLTNLTDAAHAEYIESLKVNTAVRRGAFLKISFAY